MSIKRFIIIILVSFVFIRMNANEKVTILENLCIINNKIVQRIESLSTDKQAEYYQRFYQSRSEDEIRNLNSEFFTTNSNEINSNMQSLVDNIIAYKNNSYNEEDFQTFAALHPSNEDPPSVHCKCMPCFERCSNWMVQIGIFFEQTMTWAATGAAIGGVFGGTFGMAGGPETAAAGAFGGSQWGLVIGWGYGNLKGLKMAKDKKQDCWAVHCEGKDLNPEGMGGGMPPGGPTWKKIEWAGF